MLPSMKCRDLVAACFIYLSMFLFLSLSPPPPSLFSIDVKFSPGYTRLNFSLCGDSKISILLLLSKASLPEDIIKSNESASLTIC